MAVLTTYQVTAIEEDEMGFPEYTPGDREYDWGLAEDGWQNPPPCIIDGAIHNTCTSPGYTGNELG